MSTRNPNLKKANAEVELTYDQLLELERCAEDPVYFVKNYVKIQHPTRGAISFDLYPYQEEMLRMYQNNRYCIALSARQTGKSITSAAFLLWFAIFHDDKTILIASNKNSNAMEMIFRIRYAYENLPMWLKPGVKDDGWNKHNIAFDNESRIISEATSENSGRGLSISLVFLDEFAFVKKSVQDDFWTSIAPTLSTGGACIITSTPNGDMDIFATIWRGSQVPHDEREGVGVNGFASQFVAWDEPPGRDEKFKADEIGRLGQRKWDQEYECQFLSSDALLISSVFLAQLTLELDQTKPIAINKDVTFYEAIKQGSTYLLGVDPATGSGEDYSVITVFEFPSMNQVAEWRKNTMSTNGLYGVLKGLLFYMERMETTVYFSVENNGVGEGVIALYEADENPPVNSEFVSEEGAKRKGFTTTTKSKMKACVNFREMLENRSLNIKSQTLLAELKAYARSRGTYNAQTGSTDDAISAALIVVRLLEEISQFEQEAFDKLYSGANTADIGGWDTFDPNQSYDEYADPIVF